MSTDECGLGWSVVEDVMCPSLIFSRLCLCCAAEKSEEKDKENQRSMHACRKKGKVLDVELTLGINGCHGYSLEIKFVEKRK